MFFKKPVQMGGSTPNLGQQMAMATTLPVRAPSFPANAFQDTLKSALVELEGMKSGLRAIGCEMVIYKSQAGFHMFMHTPHEKDSGNQRMLLSFDFQGEQHHGEYVSISLITRMGQANGLLAISKTKNFMPDGSAIVPGSSDLNSFIHDGVIQAIGPERTKALDRAIWPMHLPDQYLETPKQPKIG